MWIAWQHLQEAPQVLVNWQQQRPIGGEVMGQDEAITSDISGEGLDLVAVTCPQILITNNRLS